MFHDRSLARLLSTAAFAALALCFAPGALAFPEETEDPGTPPSEFPEHSGEMNEFGSTFIFSFSRTFTNADGTVFVPQAVINCNTCSFPVASGSTHTFNLTGRVLGQIRGNDGVIVPNSAGVYDMNTSIMGVKATVLTSVDVGGGFFEQTIEYTANLRESGKVSGQLELDVNAKPLPDPLPPGAGDPVRRIVTVGAEQGVTEGLNTDSTTGQLTFPLIPASSPAALGQEVPANVVLRVTERKRVPCRRDPTQCS